MANTEWYYSRGRDRNGPVSAGRLSQLAQSGELLPDDNVWKAGMEGWVPARQIKQLKEVS